VNLLSLVPIFLIGLLGGVHCVGMCGGIVGAFSVAGPPAKAFPIAVVTETRSVAFPPEGSWRVLAFNLGRIASYMVAGAVAGLLGSIPALIHITTLQSIGYWLANVLLIALGLTLMNLWHGLARVESLGLWMWRRVQPLIRRFLPVETMWQAAALGSLWGWVPCGMVYSVLMTALLTGSALHGALVMLAFGLGTLPLLFSMGLLGTRLQANLQKPSVRMIAGLVVLSFGLLGMFRLSTGLSHGWLDAVCVTPSINR
jgi:sulfite exporter TauE/SafE